MSFLYRHTGRLPIHGDASAKATLYRDRFLLLFQRLSRDPHFSRPAFDTDVSEYGTCEVLSPISLSDSCFLKDISTLNIKFAAS